VPSRGTTPLRRALAGRGLTHSVRTECGPVTGATVVAYPALSRAARDAAPRPSSPAVTGRLSTTRGSLDRSRWVLSSSPPLRRSVVLLEPTPVRRSCPVPRVGYRSPSAALARRLSTPTPLPEELAGRAPPGTTERGPPAVGEGTATHRFGLRVTWLVALLAGRTRQRTLSSATPRLEGRADRRAAERWMIPGEGAGWPGPPHTGRAVHPVSVPGQRQPVARATAGSRSGRGRRRAGRASRSPCSRTSC
jgi:hypothetical protein